MIILGFLQASLLFGGTAAYAENKHNASPMAAGLLFLAVISLILAGAAAGNRWGT